MERRLHHAALAQVELAFAGEQSFAQQDAGALQHAALGKAALPGDQDVLDQFRFIEEERVHRAELEMGQVAVLRAHAG